MPVSWNLLIDQPNVMYAYIIMSHRTQITLTDEQYERLVAESERSGLSIAELVRRSIDVSYPPRSHSDFVAALDAVFGIWADREETAEEYVDRWRPGLGQLDQ